MDFENWILTFILRCIKDKYSCIYPYHLIEILRIIFRIICKIKLSLDIVIQTFKPSLFMKTNFLLFLSIIVLFATSCQKKQIAYFQKSSSEQFTNAKKTQTVLSNQEIETQAVTNEFIEVVPTQPVENLASNDEKIVVEPTIISEESKTAPQPISTQPKAKKIAKWKEKAIVKTLDRMAEKVASKTLKPMADYNRLGTISGILGLLGLVFLFLGGVAGFLPLVGLLMGITALVTGIISSKRADKKGMSIVGIVTGILNILILLLIIVLVGSLLANFGG